MKTGIIMKHLLGILILVTSTLGSESMVKVVYRVQGPTVDEAAYAAQPRTVYRVGAAMGRVEESCDSDFGMHALIILNRQDVWMINRINSVGMHFIAPDPERGFRVPIVPATLPLRDGKAGGFEIGRELEFMVEQGVVPVSRTEDCNQLEVYETEVDGVTLTLYCAPDSGLPLRSEARKDGRILVEIVYEAYQRDLPVDPRLFVPEDGLEITEHSRTPSGSVASALN